MKEIKLEAVVRDTRGKGAARSLRREGLVPGVLYGYKTDNMALAVKQSDLLKILHDPKKRRMVVELIIKDNGGTSKKVIIKDVQNDVIRHLPIHVDFYALDETRKMRVEVPVTLTGEPIGVKNGGILRHHMDEIEVKCLPHDIPEEVTIDVSDLDIGDAIFLKDLKTQVKYEFVGDPAQIIVSVEHPAAEAEVVEVEEEEMEVEEGAPAAEAEKEEKEEKSEE
ncbi:MAG: 50S ribosomal protein L25 [Deltaproteobacteria bacterium]|nr:MAG: 50S ribosomal protein L25 [Deltaproteobacteria bacterium]